MNTTAGVADLSRQTQPIVSVIIVVYNAVSTIESAIDSVINQTSNNQQFNVDLLVIDGGSIDGTVNLIHQYDRLISYWISEPDKGIYDAMNKGVKQAKGKWIYFLGADDQLRPDVLTTIVPILESTTATIVYGSVVYDNQRVFKSALNWKTLLQNTVHHQSAFYEKSLFINFQYNTAIKIIADYELNLIAWQERIPTQKIDTIVAQCASGGSSFNTKLSLQETNFIRQLHTTRLVNICLSSLLNLKYFIHYVLLRKV